MTVRLHNINVDSRDSYTLSRWWTQVTGWDQGPEDPNEPEHPQNWIGPAGGGLGLLFCNVPESKSIKNRLHLDLSPIDRTRDEEVQRLIGIGATLISDCRRPDGTGWVVLADPEGNEFCIERSDAERAA